MIRNLLGRIKKFVFSILKKEVERVEGETTIFQTWIDSTKYGFECHSGHL